ncbi:outer-membrane lipoprotein lolB [Candidatus Photodesmus katoptron]|uniref:Outer-membrane lipoprotein LolB n=1 Tax=Candidatus Photodesmus katoptron Akat1 TaxID=1236703 RepID=S3DHN3_9GAMM|nr:lipoprotein insertase outer membrane protein LolB [Candidatus Photodesmus katoptron]EPE37952.1 outer membrane lipoprotein LolB [Candidatus Photodesmus katoptron Akat1]KEY90261.1 outer-membrane lipoprotein lolB [Candidatus Photodesmus katoptron]
MIHCNQTLSLIRIITLVLLLVGCSSNKQEQDYASIPLKNNQQKVAKIKNYQAIGKLVYNLKDKKQSCNFQWKYTFQNSSIKLINFFGQPILGLNIKPDSAQLKTYYNNKIFLEKNTTTLFRKLIGLNIPLEQLQYWIIGKPEDADIYQMNENNILTSLSKKIDKKLWHVYYYKYQNVSLDELTLLLPKKIQIRNDNIQVDLIILKWILNQ